MKNILFIAVCLLINVSVNAQDAQSYYEKGLEKAQIGDYDKALELFNKSIELKPDEYVAWYNRAIVKSMTGHYEDAMVDLEQTIKLNPGYKKAYLNRGTAKKHLTDYSGAMQDYTFSIQLDSAYAEAYYNRGLVYEMFGKKELACSDFTKALQYGYERAQHRVSKCNDTTAKATGEIHAILNLSKTSDNRKYGFTPEFPVRVGTGYDGGPANQRAYLDLLRDAQNQPVTYIRVSSCCGYSSPNGLNGLAMLDKYELTYHNETGEEKKAYVYMSFYDYEDPQVLSGFKTVIAPH
ncbi:MAG: Tetratricopeptide 2 repeat protein [Bacteroidota bacterium]|nr:Tetratricopeptide 2 repeat protein [Bacteroidota bacterium]